MVFIKAGFKNLSEFSGDKINGFINVFYLFPGILQAVVSYKLINNEMASGF